MVSEIFDLLPAVNVGDSYRALGRFISEIMNESLDQHALSIGKSDLIPEDNY